MPQKSNKSILENDMSELKYISKTNELLSSLDIAKFPETVACLEQSSTDEIPAYELATNLVNCDRTSEMLRPLFDFIVALYTEECDKGNHFAMNDLGALYYDGRGCEQDFTKAVYYYDMAAKLGNRQAQENLGYCYYYGRNIPVDYEKAFHYFALGAFDGHLISLYKIGDMYMHGYYVEKNPVEAFHIYERCLETMTDEAALTVAGPVFLRLGNALLYGYGTEGNAISALACFQKAELYLFDMVARGDVMYKKSLQEAIKGQELARKKMVSELPDTKWLDDNND